MKLPSSLHIVLLLLTLSLAPAGAAWSDGVEKVHVNTNRRGLALGGHDAVAYFAQAKAVMGDRQFSHQHQGATYHFSSAEHRDMFAADPAKYAPQFGGFCAWAVSQGYTADVDPRAFDIIDGRLILQYSLSVRERFRKDPSGNLARADENWKRILEEKGKPAE